MNTKSVGGERRECVEAMTQDGEQCVYCVRKEDGRQGEEEQSVAPSTGGEITQTHDILLHAAAALFETPGELI